MPVYTTHSRTSRRRQPAQLAAGNVDAVAVVYFHGENIVVNRAARNRHHRPDAGLAVVYAALAARANDRARCYAVIFTAGDDAPAVITIRRHSKALSALLERMRAHDQVELVGEARYLRELGLLA